MIWATLLTLSISIIYAISSVYLFPASDLYFFILPLLYMFIPGIIGFILAKKEGVHLSIFPSGKRFSSTFKLLLKAFLIPVGLALITLSINIAFTTPTLEHSFMETVQIDGVFSIGKTVQLFLIFSLLLIGLSFSLNAIVAIGQEYMWRGYMLKQLEHYPLWKQAVTIGAVWGVWYAPLILLFGQNYPNSPIFGSFMMIAICILLSPIMIRLTRKSHFIYVPALFNATLNSIASLSLIVFPNTNPLYTSVIGLSGLVVLLGLNGYLYLRKEWVLA